MEKREAGELYFEGKNQKVVTRTKCSLCKSRYEGISDYEWSLDEDLPPQMALFGLIGHIKEAHAELWDLAPDEVEIVGGGRRRKVLLTQAVMKRVGDRRQLLGNIKISAG